MHPRLNTVIKTMKVVQLVMLSPPHNCSLVDSSLIVNSLFYFKSQLVMQNLLHQLQFNWGIDGNLPKMEEKGKSK